MHCVAGCIALKAFQCNTVHFNAFQWIIVHWKFETLHCAASFRVGVEDRRKVTECLSRPPSSDHRSSTIISTTTINVIITISRFWIFYSHHIISENHHWQNLEKSQSNQNHWQNALILFINWFFPSSTTVYHPLVQPIFRGKTKCLLSQHITSVFSNHQHTSAHNST